MYGCVFLLADVLMCVLVGTCYAMTAFRKQSDVIESHSRDDAVCLAGDRQP